MRGADVCGGLKIHRFADIFDADGLMDADGLFDADGPMDADGPLIITVF